MIYFLLKKIAYLKNSSNCHYSCLQCVGNNLNQCAECPIGRIYFKGKCICKANTYDVKGKQKCAGFFINF